ncbi:MAG: methyltransferase [Candidatus Latescibacterota bacterium]|nr:methyltransferase [Candidatus Latescibacterota bacterium]
MEKIESRIRLSRKYKDIHPSVILRQIHQLRDRFVSDKDLEQAVRRKLHQAFGAYLGGNWLRKLEKAVSGEIDPVRDTCRNLMVLHASTRERIPDLDEVTAALVDHIAEDSQVVDLACGLNVLTLPWLFERKRFRYLGIDLHLRMVEAMVNFVQAAELDAAVSWGDVLSPDVPQGDVAMMLKLLPCLEHQDEGSALRMVLETQADVILASFPTRSIGGRAKGMDHTYHRRIEIIANESGRELERLAFSSETIFVLKK